MNATFNEIPASEHGIEPAQISRAALQVVSTLQKAGHKAYIVGGAPRDLLLGVRPKDFDVGTDALPEQVRKLFRRARLIGRRFRLAHVRFGREVVEVATFRGFHGEGERDIGDGGRVLRDNVYGSESDDALRRDFTINALMYDPLTGVIRDYAGGVEDLRARRLRLIGDPETRFREDPVRMLRAVRFKVKLGLEIDQDTERWIPELAPLLADIPPARLLDELLKLFLGGAALKGYRALVDYGLWEQLFPGLLAHPEQPPDLLVRALASTDERVADDRPVTPGFLFAALFWERVKAEADRRIAEGQPPVDALAAAGDWAFSRYCQRVAVHRRFAGMAREIWMFQPRFERRTGKRAMRLLQERRFRAAYDFLVLRAHSEPELVELARFWTELQEADPETRQQMLAPKSGKGRGKKPRTRKRP
ncbi:MAG: polynucleotide adenylyltransferase PcnB [Wenzhouxiangellaceae bacterium]